MPTLHNLKGYEALQYFVTKTKGPVLDIGSGQGYQADYMRQRGLEVVTLDNKAPADLKGDFMDMKDSRFSAIHCCHVLEHHRNPGLFLDHINRVLLDDGWLCITVPPLKHEIVGGHATLWNAGLLVYHLVLAGFDCAKAWVKTYGYNVSVVVQKRAIELPRIRMAGGDIELLSEFFPWSVAQGFDGRQDARPEQHSRQEDPISVAMRSQERQHRDQDSPPSMARHAHTFGDVQAS